MPTKQAAKSRPQQSTPLRLPYVRLDAGFHLARIIDMTPSEAGDYFRRMLIALNTGQRGIMHEADDMMAEAESYFIAKRNAGRMGGKATQGKRSSSASSDASSHTNKHTNKHLASTKQGHRASRAMKEYPPNAKPKFI
jgi:hypothetical protein